jgi:hypothetical protein
MEKISFVRERIIVLLHSHGPIYRRDVDMILIVEHECGARTEISNSMNEIIILTGPQQGQVHWRSSAIGDHAGETWIRFKCVRTARLSPNILADSRARSTDGSAECPAKEASAAGQKGKPASAVRFPAGRPPSPG